MNFINDLQKDEIRSGFVVTSDRKKVWNVGLNILKLIDDLCKKHNIKYFADYGTMLGAVRHKGFIPWDDDIDVSMMRPDYERFQKIAASEIKPPYFLQNSYSDRMGLLSKIRDSRTSAIEFPENREMNQGIFIDIYPLDASTDGTAKGERLRKIQRELWMAVMAPEDVKTGLNQGLTTEFDRDELLDIAWRPPKDRMRAFESFLLDHFYDTERIGSLHAAMHNPKHSRRREYHKNSVDMPFESLTVPVPSGYEELLKIDYGENWRVPVRGGTAHQGVLLSADIPYDEFLKKVEIVPDDTIMGPGETLYRLLGMAS